MTVAGTRAGRPRGHEVPALCVESRFKPHMSICVAGIHHFKRAAFLFSPVERPLFGSFKYIVPSTKNI